MILHEVTFPAALRNDGLARTFSDEEGVLYVLPVRTHDFEATAQLAKHGLSDARVIELEGSAYVAFGEKSDPVSLRSVVVSALTSPDYADAITVIRAVMTALRQQRELLGSTVRDPSPDGIVFDQFTQRVEFLPPYQMAGGVSAEETFAIFRERTLADVDDEDKEYVNNLFELAVRRG